MLVFVYCPIWFQIIKHETYYSMEYNVLACCKKALPPFHNYCSVSKYGFTIYGGKPVSLLSADAQLPIFKKTAIVVIWSEYNIYWLKLTQMFWFNNWKDR